MASQQHVKDLGATEANPFMKPYPQQEKYMTNGFHHESRPLADGFDEAQAVAARKRKRVRTPGSAQPIYGVVVKKSGLTHYGTIDKAGKCPFHFHVIVQDQTRSAVMVTIWLGSRFSCCC